MNKKVIILGAGISGLSTAWKLSEAGFDVEIIEIDSKIGGVSSTFNHKGYNLDYGPHKIYTQMPYVLDEIKQLLDDDLITIPKRSRIRLMGKYFDYPVGMKDVVLKFNPLIGAKCGFGLFSTKVKKIFSRKEESYEQYLIHRFGKGLYSLVFEGYAKKVWGDPKKLSAELAKTRVSIPGILALFKNMVLGSKGKPNISADQFYYPKKGIIELSEAMAEIIKKNEGKIHLNSKPIKIQYSKNKGKSIFFEKDSEIKKINFDYLISTIPLNDFLGLFSPQIEKNILENARKLKRRSLILLYIVINKKRLFPDNWIFYPEQEFIFNRLSEQKGFSESMIPSNKTVLTVEITCDEDDFIWTADDSAVFKKAMKDLEKAEIIKEKDVADYFITKLSKIYPVYDLDYKNNLSRALDFIDKFENIYSIGRPGLFNYNNMDHCIDIGNITAKHIIKNKDKKEWQKTREKFNSYRIVD